MAEEPKKSKARSPNYPGIGLELALEKAQALLRANGPNFVAANVAITGMGYAPKSGPGTIALGALKKFGLLDEEGRGETRRVKVSELARLILIDERPGSAERAQLLRKAALNPPLHQAIWKRYPHGLPSDASVIFDLQKEGFTRKGAEDFLKQFKSTMQYAGVDTSASIGELGEAETDEEPEDMGGTDLMETTLKPPSGNRILNIPLTRSRSAVVQLPNDLDTAAWDQMMRVLDAMKPGLLTEPEPEHTGYQD